MKYTNEYDTHPLSGSVEANNTLYVSGQICLKDGNLMNESIKAETLQTLENLKKQILDAKFDFKKVVKVTIYTTDLKSYADINSVYADYFEKPYPAREVVEVSGLPLDARIEINAIVVK